MPTADRVHELRGGRESGVGHASPRLHPAQCPPIRGRAGVMFPRCDAFTGPVPALLPSVLNGELYPDALTPSRKDFPLSMNSVLWNLVEKQF